MKESELRVLLDLYMVSDPWPLKEHADGVLEDLLNRESGERGFSSWVVAYHEFMPSE